MQHLEKIADVAARYKVSTRTLRYYEQIGLLWSERPDPAQPRYYAPEAIRRLEQILALRSLETPIKEIARLFALQDPAEAMGAFTDQLRALEIEQRQLRARRELLESLLKLFRREEQRRPMKGPGLPQEIAALAQRTLEIRQDGGWHPVDAERVVTLTNVRIVTLPPMRVARYNDPVAPTCFESWHHMIAWVGEYELSTGRAFGYTSRNPEGIRPQYGYTVLVALPPGYEPTGHIEAVDFPGGLYAVTTTWYREAAADWRALRRWVEEHTEYQVRPGLLLEELNSFSYPVNVDSLLDLFYPIERKEQPLCP